MAGPHSCKPFFLLVLLWASLGHLSPWLWKYPAGTPSETFSLVTCSWLYLQFIQGTGAHQSLHVSPRCTLRGAQRDAGSRLAGVGSMAQQDETIALSVYLCQYCDFRPRYLHSREGKGLYWSPGNLTSSDSLIIPAVTLCCRALSRHLLRHQ